MRFHTAQTTRASVQHQRERGDERVAALIAVTYELLDAHADTDGLAAGVATEGEWENHLAYLRDLQRVGRETLARAAATAL